MVIRFVTMSHFLFMDSLTELAVYESYPFGRRQRLVLEDTPHVMQEPDSAGQQRRRIIHMLQKMPGILISLLRRQREPTDSGFSVLGDILSKQIQLAERILCILVPLLRRLCQPVNRLCRIFLDTVAV